jgi:hypothetical protein
MENHIESTKEESIKAEQPAFDKHARVIFEALNQNPSFKGINCPNCHCKPKLGPLKRKLPK